MTDLTGETIASAKKRLAHLLEEELLEIEGKKDKLRAIYEHIPATLRRVNELTGIDIDLLISMSRAAYHYQDLEWYQVLDVMASVYLAKRNIEEDAKQCEVHNCKTPSAIELMFTSGMKGRYCKTHAATFDPEIIEESRELEQE